MTLRSCFFATLISLLTIISAAAEPVFTSPPFRPAETVWYPDTIPATDSTALVTDSLILSADSLQLKEKKSKKPRFDAPIVYSSDDSLIFSVSKKEIELFKGAKVNYQNIDLSADYVQFDMNTQTVYAHGMPDSVGKIVGLPNFKQGSETFDAHFMNYNFKTKKAYVVAVKSKQDGGYLHADTTKRLSNGNINIKNGKYTTCDLDHPHFYLALTKAVDIPNKKIVSGPAYLVLEDVPLPIGIPFGFFPTTRKSVSGVLIPTYGEEVKRGLYLRDGGYYLVLSDHWDFRLTGDIYSKGTWGLSANTNYRKIYKFSGSFSGTFYKNITSEKGLPDYSASKDFSITWSHRQDPKANPTRTFSANVNFSSSSYDKDFSHSLTQALTTSKSSSISYSKVWKYAPFNFSAGFTHNQNSQTNLVELGLPKMTFNMGTVYPLRWANKTGREKWYDNVQFSYSSSLENNISTADSLMFTNRMFRNMNNGFKQSIPLSWNFKPINGINIAPSLNYSAVMYTSHIEKHWNPNYIDPITKDTGGIVTDTIRGMSYAHALYPALSISVNPKIYGMYQFRGDRIKAIRHVMSPSVSFSYIPDLSKFMPNYYRTVTDSVHKTSQVYSIYQNGMYGTPSAHGQSASMNFSLRNTLEMKARSRNDTAETYKKVSLLENFDFQTSYNIITKTWSTINFNTGTRLLNNKINVQLNAIMNPYALDSAGNTSRVLIWTRYRRIARVTSAQLTLSMNLSSKQGGKSKSGTNPNSTNQNVDAQEGTLPVGQQNQLTNNPSQMVDFSIPWNFNINYSVGYSQPAFTPQIIQTARLSGDLSLTKKWKIGINSGYDFQTHKITATDISIYRDLHCWEMRISCVPFGPFQSYNFYINVKSSMLKDLKYTKQKSWYDNF